MTSLRHSLAPAEDRVITKEAEASVVLTASVSSASVVSGLEIRISLPGICFCVFDLQMCIT